jgi:protein translocase SecG subunit
MVTFFMVLLSVLAILSAILMIVVIMLQNNKGGGGLGAVSGGITETMFGASAATVLVKITIALAAIFMCSTLLLATVTGWVRSSRSVAETYMPASVETIPEVQPIDLVPALEEGGSSTEAVQLETGQNSEKSEEAAEK